MNIQKGDQVIVHHDPVTCKKLEGLATVTKVLEIGNENFTDIQGRPIFRCRVRFPGERQVLERWVSHG